MITQRYTIKAEDPDGIKPAQLVFENDDSDIVTGFINDINGDQIEIILFEMTDLTHIKDLIISYSDEIVDWIPLLLTAIEKNPEMKEFWEEVLTLYSNQQVIH
jgi:hypothetical protein